MTVQDPHSDLPADVRVSTKKEARQHGTITRSLFWPRRYLACLLILREAQTVVRPVAILVIAWLAKKIKKLYFMGFNAGGPCFGINGFPGSKDRYCQQQTVNLPESMKTC